MASGPKFTSQQAAAIETRGVSIALSAGAGCGKTFVLTQRFLAGLEPETTQGSPVDLHQLVAITFTDRAAREMRDRIRAACNERLQNCNSQDVDHWLGILRGLDGARISTIHSFCTSLLRSHAVDAGLDPRFTVLEAALSDTLLRQVARDTLHSLIEESNDDAVNLVVLFGLERSEDLLRKLTRQRFQIDFSRFLSMTPDDLVAHWLEKWQTEFVPRLVADFRSSPLIDQVLELIQSSPSKNKVMMDRLANLATLLPPQTPWQNVTETLATIREDARVQGGGGKKDWVSEESQEAIKLAFEKLRKNATSLEDKLNVPHEDVVKSAEVACRAVRLAHKTAEEYAAAKQQQGALDFDDLLLHARNLLRDNESVRQRVAAGIRLLMVDEFQDTDPVQADVVRSLCGAAMTRGKLFMVGDRKQSIYRFRRADPTVFATMSSELPPSGRLPLNVNFRSQPAVLNFVNHLFAAAMDNYEALTPFDNQQSSPTPAIEFLFATFDEEDKAPSLEADSDLGSDSEDEKGPSAAELRRREAHWIARRISNLLADPTPRIRTKNRDANGRSVLRRAEPGDIVILFRALSNVQDYEAALREEGLDYYLVGGKAFYAQQEVFDLLNLCRYLDDSDDVVALVGILRSPFFNLSDDSIHALALHSGDAGSPSSPDERRRSDASDAPPALPTRPTFSLHDALLLEPPGYLPTDQQTRIRFAASLLTELRQLKDRIPLSELLTQAMERTGYDAAVLAEFLGARKLANLRKLIEMARQFDQGGFFTLKDFVTRLQTSVLEETDEEFATTQPESGDVIRLMSIHQSKGLEFPVVIVADIDRKGPPRGSDAVLHPELGPLIKLPEQFGKTRDNLGLKMHLLAEKEADAEETIRLFYVACTRAADYLILSAGIDPDKPAESPWRELLESRFDISTGLLKGDPLLGSSTAGTAGRDDVPEVLVHRVPCKSHRGKVSDEKYIPIGEVPGRVIAADPKDLPSSARVFPADTHGDRIISVSTLEKIDAELSGLKHDYERANVTIADETAIDPDQATLLGILVHEVLERTDFLDTSNWQDSLKRAVRHSSDVVPDKVIEQAEGMLERFFASDIPNELAAARHVHREIEFFLPWNMSHSDNPASGSSASDAVPMIAGVIDLLVQDQAGWQIMDYKTGDFPVRKSEQEQLAAYEMQLALYAHAVEQWFGVVPQQLSLIVFRPEIRRITMPWSPKKWNEIRLRVDRALRSIMSEVGG